MKVSVITYQNVMNNYGAVLQAFATQEKLREYLPDVELINFWKEHMTVKGAIKRNAVKAIFKMPSFISWKKMYRKFCKQNLNVTQKVYKSSADFQSFPIHNGLYCTGSDQVWNPMWGNDLEPLYLSFIPEGYRKISYATSFGVNRLEDSIVSKYKEYIHQYEHISVREDTGLKILHEQFGYNDAVQLADPTLAMTPEFWRGYAPKSKIKGEYILLYCIHRSKQFTKYADKLSAKTKLPIIRLCQSYHNFTPGMKNVLIPPVFEFITLIDNAKYVLTDSFHAMAFSVLLNTEPVYISAGTAHAGRIDSLLRLVGIEHRRIIDFNDFDVIKRPVDWEQVNTVLAHERERVDEFLSSVFREGDSD